MSNEIFGLPEEATFEEITEAYQRLKAQYSEDRFAEGEKGNQASRKLMELEQAYSDASFKHAAEADNQKYGKDYGAADELIKQGKIEQAQAALDAMAERTGEWHYLQSIIFYKRGWFAESKKQLRLACNMEPDNAKFMSAEQRMDEFVKSGGRPVPPPNSNMSYGPGGPQNGMPPQDRNMSYADCCLDACCLASCLSCCMPC